MKYRISDGCSQATGQHDNLADAILEAHGMRWRWGFDGLAVQVRGRRDWLTPSVRDDRYYPAYPYRVSSAVMNIPLTERCCYVAICHEQKILAWVDDVANAPCGVSSQFEVMPNFSGGIHDDTNKK